MQPGPSPSLIIDKAARTLRLLRREPAGAMHMPRDWTHGCVALDNRSMQEL